MVIGSSYWAETIRHSKIVIRHSQLHTLNIFIHENSVIGQVGSNADLEVCNTTFEHLKAFAHQHSSHQILNYFVQRGQEYVSVKNYVGLLTLPDFTQIEILPKISSDTAEAKTILLQMLRFVPHLPFKKLPVGSLKNAAIPLWEVFIGLFLDEIEAILQKGLQRDYDASVIESNFLRGKWLFNQKPSTLNVRFMVEIDDFKLNTPPNQLLKACLKNLKKNAKSLENKRRISQFYPLFNEVSDINPIKFSENQINHSKYVHYQTAIEWAKVILNQHSWLGQAGKSLNCSLLFQTERLFELYISQGFKKYFTDFKVFTQKSEQFLIEEHNGQKQFQLRPDIILKNETHCIIFDAKWKNIDVSAQSYGLDQRDLYQLYAYGQKHKAYKLFLIYPATSTFNSTPPPFRFDENFTLYIWPIQLSNPLSTEMEKLNDFLKTVLR